MEINKNWGLGTFDKNEKWYIYKLILERFPFPLEDAEKEELKRYMEHYILHLEINDYVVKNIDIIDEAQRPGVKVLFRTTAGIGEITIEEGEESENQTNLLTCFLRIYPSHDISEINVCSFKRDDTCLHNLWIDIKRGDEHLFLEYKPHDTEARNFVSNLLYGVK